MRRLALALLASTPVASLPFAPAIAQAPAKDENAVFWRSAAMSLEPLVNANYACLDDLPGGEFALTETLRQEAEAVHDRRSLVRFAERAILLLANHHVNLSSNLTDSWAIVPTFSDLWVERRGEELIITAVRDGSPASQAGIREGGRLVAVGGVPTGQALAAFWSDLGTSGSVERDGFAARLLASGRRNAPRDLTVRDPDGRERRLELASVYDTDLNRHAEPVEAVKEAGLTTILINNALGNNATIAAFDAAMRAIPSNAPLVLDLRETPSGGNNTVAEAIMGWFAAEPTPYQWHRDVAAARRWGVANQWWQVVAPRGERRHIGPVTVRVGRWTGSMGEGIALGMARLGARVCGGAMAQLKGGAGRSFTIGESDVGIQLQTQQLMAIDGTPREDFVPPPCTATLD